MKDILVELLGEGQINTVPHRSLLNHEPEKKVEQECKLESHALYFDQIRNITFVQKFVEPHIRRI
jgi:hypothetical protein